MAMYFVQHGLAVSKEINSDRPLSEEGRKATERISAHLKRSGVKIEKVYHSGKTRAEETAKILADQIGGSKLSELSGMSPNDDVKKFASTLKEEDAMYVGHLPHMEKLVSNLVAGDEAAGVVKFSNSGVVCIEKDNSGFRIIWYLVPCICNTV
jgi:phosphohistidine phosphatase